MLLPHPIMAIRHLLAERKAAPGKPPVHASNRHQEKQKIDLKHLTLLTLVMLCISAQLTLGNFSVDSSSKYLMKIHSLLLLLTSRCHNNELL